MKKPILKSAASPAAVAIVNKGLLTAALIFIVNSVFAQGQTVAAANQFKTTFFTILNIAALIGFGWGAFQVIMGFIGPHKEEGMKRLIYWVVALVVWGAVKYFINDFGGNTSLN